MKHKFQWKKQTLKLKSNHSWKASAGYRVFVMDRGAVRFNIPQNWIIEPESDCIAFYDKKPPDDNCKLAVSYLGLPDVNWSDLPLTLLIESIIKGDQREVLTRGNTVKVPRADLEVTWTEIRFMDPSKHREAFSRIALARSRNLQALVTFDFWPEDITRLNPVWEEVIRSLELGRYVDNPTVGDILH